MNRIIIIGEGQTEQEFSNDVLQPFFNHHNIQLQNLTIKKTKGGIVKWSVLKQEIENHLRQSSSAVVTTFIDYYGIKDFHAFPKWEEAEAKVDRTERMQIIEGGWLLNIDIVYLPYGMSKMQK